MAAVDPGLLCDAASAKWEREELVCSSGGHRLSHPAYLPFAVMVAVVTVAAAHAGSGNPGLVHAGIAAGSDAGSGSQDDSDGPSPVIATGDFNRDGVADVVEATSPDDKDSSQHFLTVRLGQADGTFKTLASSNLVGADPRALVVGDFNGDGNPDVIVGDGDGVLQEFLGDGKGNLMSRGDIATLGSVVSLAIGHFTPGGKLDVAVSDVRSNSASILVGAGDGSFHLTWSFPLPRIGTEFHLATADFNGDGIGDLVITNEDDDNYEVMLGNGNGTFTYAPELSHLKDPNSYCPS
jgi:hypothetical protein